MHGVDHDVITVVSAGSVLDIPNRKRAESIASLPPDPPLESDKSLHDLLYDVAAVVPIPELLQASEDIIPMIQSCEGIVINRYEV